MTVLIYSDNKIYTDSLCTSRDTVVSTDSAKCHLVKTKKYGTLLLAFAGSYSVGLDLIRQLEADVDVLDLDRSGMGIEAFAISDDGNLYELYDLGKHLAQPNLLGLRWFGGSGISEAIAIMTHGEDCPVETIRTVSKINTSCGGNIVSYGFDDLRNNQINIETYLSDGRSVIQTERYTPINPETD